MPASILPLHSSTNAPALPIDALHEIDAQLTLLSFALERASHPDFVDVSHTQIAAISNHALRVQRDFQQFARRVLAFAGHPADADEFAMGNPAIERLQRAALHGDPLSDA